MPQRQEIYQKNEINFYLATDIHGVKLI